MDHKSGNYFETDPIENLMRTFTMGQLTRLGSPYYFQIIDKDKLKVFGSDDHEFILTITMTK